MSLPPLTAAAPTFRMQKAEAPTARLPRQMDPIATQPDKQVTFIHEAAPDLGARPQVDVVA